jgi:hypothetical protein
MEAYRGIETSIARTRLHIGDEKRHELGTTNVSMSGDVGDVKFTTPDGVPAPTTKS